ncbi:protein CEPU-1-like [Mercenaria mercenaria]|uniref:protein CEPU-1-like n=1 Tax=Mercenaria mercenaria TaxID=6596 RepID=UPI001E1D9B53|nr:protein CEPU-1-like [Mercenaria mercenaria]
MWGCLVSLYTCIVFTVSCIHVTHAILNLTVEAKLNHEVKLPCRLPSGDYYGVNVRWFNKKDGWLTDGNTVYKHPGQIFISKPAPNEWNLHIKRISTSFEDIYTCQTAKGTVLSYIKLAVETSPRIDDEKSSPIRVTLAENTMVVLTCTVSGTPEPEIAWYRGLSETATGITGPELKIRDVTRYAADEYICRAKNTNGEAERRIRVAVNFAPEVTVMEPVVYAAGGEVVVMSCAVKASPLFDAYWTKGTDVYGTPIEPGWKYLVMVDEESDNIPVRFLTLIIRKSIVSAQDYGMYTCVAKGERHVAQNSVELRARKQKSVRVRGK